MTGPYVILGGGAAGVSAALAIRRLDSRARIVLVSDEPHRFYSRPGLAYLLAGTVPEQQLFPSHGGVDEQQDLQRVQGHAVALDSVRRRVTLQDRTDLPYERLLLAVGARAIRPTIPGIGLPGVVTLDTLDDARLILKLARRARQAVVVGGGITALELAEGLAARGLDVHYLMRKDRYWGNVLDRSESELVESRLEEAGIHLHRNTGLAEALGTNRLEGVVTQRGERLACQMLAVAVGISPRIELAVAAGIRTERGILTDEYLQTSAEGVFAAGDAAEVQNPHGGGYRLESLWSLAIAQGQCAGENMAGARRPYGTMVPLNVTRIGGVTTTIIGQVGQDALDEDLMSVSRGDSDSWRQRPEAFTVELDAASNRVRLVLGNNRILGAVIMGDQSLSRPLQHLVGEGVDISPIRAELVEGKRPLPDVILSYWSSLRS